MTSQRSDFVPGLYAAKRKKELAEKRNRELRDQENGGQDKQKDIVKMPKNPTLEGLRGGEADLSDTLGGTGVMIGSVEGPAANGFASKLQEASISFQNVIFSLRGADESSVEVPEVGTESIDDVGDDDEEDRTPEGTLNASGKDAIAEIANNNKENPAEEEVGPETVSPDISPRVSQDASKDTSGFSNQVASSASNNNKDDRKNEEADGNQTVDDKKEISLKLRLLQRQPQPQPSP